MPDRKQHAKDSNDCLSVVVADQASVSLAAVVAILEMDAEITVVGQASNGLALMKLVGELEPDVVVTDVRMPIMDGLSAVEELKEHWPGIQVVVLSLECCAYGDALAAGADAFVAKGDPAQALLAAVHSEPGATQLGARGGGRKGEGGDA